MESLTLKLDSQRFAIQNLEEEIQMVLPDLLRIVQHIEIHLLTWSQRTSPWLDLKNLLVQDLLFKCLLLAWRAWVSPRLHLNLTVVWHFELPVSLDSTNVLQAERDATWLRSILDWQLSEVPREVMQVSDHLLARPVCLV